MELRKPWIILALTMLPGLPAALAYGAQYTMTDVGTLGGNSATARYRAGRRSHGDVQSHP